MILGFSDRRSKGSKWRAIRAFSRVKDGLIFLICCVDLPRCVMISI